MADDIGTSHLISVANLVPCGVHFGKQTLLCKVVSLTILRIEFRQNLNCLRQVRLSVLHILDILFVCRLLLIADEVRIVYFLS